MKEGLAMAELKPCLRKYKPATNKTDAPKDWPSYLDLPKRRDGGEGNG